MVGALALVGALAGAAISARVLLRAERERHAADRVAHDREVVRRIVGEHLAAVQMQAAMVVRYRVTERVVVDAIGVGQWALARMQAEDALTGTVAQAYAARFALPDNLEQLADQLDMALDALIDTRDGSEREWNAARDRLRTSQRALREAARARWVG
jgi:hypothetical protein